jgi:polyvinyl alcohol dehydrogenase (cytochrome)
MVCFFRTTRNIVYILLALGIIAASMIVMFAHSHTVYASAGDWPTYLENAQHSGFNSAETIINVTSAPHLKMHWKYQAGGYISVNFISVQPIEAHGMIYWGSWDSNEHATNSKGAQVWQTGLGYTFSSQCNDLVGVASTATAASVSIGGISTPLIFVGGGNATFYALNALTGAITWHTSLGTSPDNFIWSSPVYYRGSIYIGLASFGDCPLVQGKLFRLNATTGAIQNTFKVVPDGCTGGGVWGSPTIDSSDGSVYFATGNSGSCSSNEPYATSLVKVKAPNLSYVDSWHVPQNQQINDSDFGATPTLFRAVIGGVTRSLVGVVNKNGIYYAFDRTAIGHGYLWRANIATTGGGCGPDCGDGSISSSAWDGSRLYIAGGQTTIGKVSCKGSLRAVNPATGRFIWEHCMQQGPVLGAVTMVPGVAVVGEGNTFVAVAASDGHTLFTFTDTNTNSQFYGPASISKGILYIGDFDGLLYAFGT